MESCEQYQVDIHYNAVLKDPEDGGANSCGFDFTVMFDHDPTQEEELEKARLDLASRPEAEKYLVVDASISAVSTKIDQDDKSAEDGQPPKRPITPWAS